MAKTKKKTAKQETAKEKATVVPTLEQEHRRRGLNFQPQKDMPDPLAATQFSS